MKQNIVHLFLLLAVILPAFGNEIGEKANQDFYYCSGEKIYLTRDSSKRGVCVVNSEEGIKEIPKVEMNNFHGEIENTIFLPCYQSETGETISMSPYINVQTKKDNDFILVNYIADRYGLSLVQRHKYLTDWFILKLTPQTKKNSLEVANEIYETGLFAESVPEFYYKPHLNCSYDTYADKQWYICNHDMSNSMNDFNLVEGWNYSTGRGVKVAVYDTPIYKNHSDLYRNVSSWGFNAENQQEKPEFMIPGEMRSQHGTCVAGIIAAERNNGIGISGIAPDVTIIPISDSLGPDSLAALNRAYAFRWAADNGIDVINCSWTIGAPPHPAMKQNIDYALKNGRNGKGTVVVFSAGNVSETDESIEGVEYPANVSELIICVSARGQKDGPEVDIYAPGSNILTTYPEKGMPNDSGYQNFSGTSAAAPIVSGMIAMMLGKYPEMTTQDIQNVISYARNSYDISNSLDIMSWFKIYENRLYENF